MILIRKIVGDLANICYFCSRKVWNRFNKSHHFNDIICYFSPNVLKTSGLWLDIGKGGIRVKGIWFGQSVTISSNVIGQ